MKKYLLAALAPVLVLLLLTLLACVVGYVIVTITGDPAGLRKILIRSTQVFLLLSIYPAMKLIPLTRQDLGVARRPEFFRQLLKGFGLGLLTLLPVFGLFYWLEINVLDTAMHWTVGLAAKKAGIALLLGLLIAIVEESIFRGMLLGALKKRVSVAAAVIISSAYFAALHFLDEKNPIPPGQFDVFSGFELLANAYTNVFNPANCSAFISLFMVGAFLAVLRTQVKDSLGLCIGCHAGWVWLMKMSGSVFNLNGRSPYFFLVSDYNYVVGPLVTVWLLLAVLGYLGYRRFLVRQGSPEA